MPPPRSRVRASSIIAGACFLISALGACGSSDTDPTPDPGSSSATPGRASESGKPDASSSKPASPNDGAEPGAYRHCKDQKPFTGKAADEFGAEEVLDAYCTMVELEMEQSFLDSHLRRDGEELAVRDFSAWTGYMTPETARRFNDHVAKALNGDPDAKQNVWAITFFGALTGSRFEFSDEPAALGKTFTPATTDLDEANGVTRLLLTFEVSANLNVTQKSDDKSCFIPIARRITFALTQNPLPTSDRNDWLIDGWNGNFTVGDAVDRPTR